MLLAIALSAFVIGPAPGPAEGARNDAVIAEEVLQVIRDATWRRPDSAFNYFDVKVEQGVVVLSGTVRHASRGRQIAGEVAQIPGVRDVRNELRSPSDGAGDERIRRELMRAIYGSLSLSRYALQAVPPIRILVERGRVVLAGRVASAVERELLTAIAHRSSAFEVENEVEVDPAVANVPAGGFGVRF
jgi:osmotically-inducible protein OsmY